MKKILLLFLIVIANKFQALCQSTEYSNGGALLKSPFSHLELRNKGLIVQTVTTKILMVTLEELFSIPVAAVLTYKELHFLRVPLSNQIFYQVKVWVVIN